MARARGTTVDRVTISIDRAVRKMGVARSRALRGKGIKNFSDWAGRCMVAELRRKVGLAHTTTRTLETR